MCPCVHDIGHICQILLIESSSWILIKSSIRNSKLSTVAFLYYHFTYPLFCLSRFVLQLWIFVSKWDSNYSILLELSELNENNSSNIHVSHVEISNRKYYLVDYAKSCLILITLKFITKIFLLCWNFCMPVTFYCKAFSDFGELLSLKNLWPKNYI